MSLKRFVGSVLITLGLSVASSAVTERAEANIYPVAYNGYYGGYYAGWGWYPIVAGYWPWFYYNYPVWSPYGYSYYADFYYQPRYSTYGAIAVSPSTLQVGLAWGEGSLSGAAYSAENYCAADDCSSVVWVRGGCAAIAKADETNQVSWGYHTERYGARRYAMRACQAAGGENCRIAAWVCSF